MGFVHKINLKLFWLFVVTSNWIVKEEISLKVIFFVVSVRKNPNYYWSNLDWFLYADAANKMTFKLGFSLKRKKKPSCLIFFSIIIMIKPCSKKPFNICKKQSGELLGRFQNGFRSQWFNRIKTSCTSVLQDDNHGRILPFLPFNSCKN